MSRPRRPWHARGSLARGRDCPVSALCRRSVNIWPLTVGNLSATGAITPDEQAADLAGAPDDEAEASSATRRLVDDGDRAGRVMQDCHTHRAEHHPPQPAPAAGPYDQQLGSGRRIQQRAPRRTLHNIAPHNHRGMVSLAFGEHLLEARLQQARAAEDVCRIRHGADRQQRDIPQRRFGEREFDCGLRSARPLSADHDGARHMTGHWPPVAAHYDHDPPRVRGDLRTHRPQRQPGPPPASRARPPRPRAPSTTMSALALKSHSTSVGDPLASSGRTSPAPMAAWTCCTPRAMTHSPYFQARSAAASQGTARPHTWHTVSTNPCARASRAAQSSASWLAADPSYPATIPLAVPAMANLPAPGLLSANVQRLRLPGTGPILLSRRDVRVVATARRAGGRSLSGAPGCPRTDLWAGDLRPYRGRPAGTDDE